MAKVFNFHSYDEKMIEKQALLGLDGDRLYGAKGFVTVSMPYVAGKYVKDRTV